MFEECDSDCEVLDIKLGGLAAFSWFKDFYRTSIVGIAEDFSFAMDSSKYRIQDIEIPMIFIQGSEDPMTTRPALDALSDLNPQSKTLTVEGAGHLTFASHPKVFWSLVGQAISSRS